jgi:hypothetical protein
MKVRSDGKYRQLAEEVGELLYQRHRAELEIQRIYDCFTKDPGYFSRPDVRQAEMARLGDAELRRIHAERDLSFKLGRAIENPRDYNPFVPPAGGAFVPPAGGAFVPPAGGAFVPPAGGAFVPPAGGAFEEDSDE